MRNIGLDEAQAGIKMTGEMSITSDMPMTPPLWQKAKNPALLSSRDGYLWELTGWTKGSQAS